VHIEAGHKLNGSFIREALIDEVLIYLAPLLLGFGREMAAFGPLERLEQAPRFNWLDMQQVGQDLRLQLRTNAPADER
jgi:diaminohydroxyphosphoribosylaminopyrimidine deaminase / 5-amino-6-(5-phosphoribosylamino)uracil reductase